MGVQKHSIRKYYIIGGFMKAKTKTALFLVISGILFFAIMKAHGGFKGAIEFVKSAFSRGA